VGLVPLVPAWTLRDGWPAVGGAEHVYPVTSETKITASTPPGDPNSPLWFTAAIGSGPPCQPATVQLSAVVGSATLHDSFTQTWQ
jgi:hypothetical protein